MLSEWLFLLLAAAPQNLLDGGRQALEAGDLTRAEQLFRQYLQEQPNSAEALSNLGAISARREQFQHQRPGVPEELRARCAVRARRIQR